MNKIVRGNLSIFVFVLIGLVLIIYEPLIFGLNNLSNIAKQASLIAIFALAQSVVLITKGLDLSQGGVITFVSVCVALLSNHVGIPLAILIGLVLGGAAGLINGYFISTFNVSPFVVTLGMGFLLQGVALVLSKGQPVYDVPPAFTWLGWHEIFNVPVIVYILLILAGMVWFYLNRTIYGRYLYAIGSNERASFLSGIHVPLHKMNAYVLCGGITALGSVILASRINGGHPVEGANTALQSVAASVIGGVSLFGGKGTVRGILLGSLLLSFISNALNIINISSYYQQIMIGAIIIIAIIIDKLKTGQTYEE